MKLLWGITAQEHTLTHTSARRLQDKVWEEKCLISSVWTRSDFVSLTFQIWSQPRFCISCCFSLHSSFYPPFIFTSLNSRAASLFTGTSCVPHSFKALLWNGEPENCVCLRCFTVTLPIILTFSLSVVITAIQWVRLLCKVVHFSNVRKQLNAIQKIKNPYQA